MSDESQQALVQRWNELHKGKVTLESIKHPDKQGWLTKQGGFPKNWKRRWFVLEGYFLYYFQEKSAREECKGVVMIKDARVRERGTFDKKDFCFVVEMTTTRRPSKTKEEDKHFVISADNNLDLQQWMQAISAAAVGRKSRPEDASSECPMSKMSSADFDLLRVIGKGSFGKVMQVRKRDTGEIYAMKVLRKEAIIKRKQVDHTKSERNILKIISHPFIVGLKFAFQTEEKLYLVLDYCSGGELFFHLKNEGKFSEERARFCAAEITMALEHLHNLDIIYRDLKPENILLDHSGHIRLTDFGLSKEEVSGHSGATTFCGTPEYLAPEMLTGQGHGKAVDWWSLGTLLYEMLTGLPPFYSQNINVMYEKILKDKLYFPPYMSADAKSMLQGLLNRDVSSRLGSLGAKEVKGHPFFKVIDWDRLYARKMDPPFRPKVSEDPADVSNFDTEFTSERAIDSVVDGSALKVDDKGTFKGFTYDPKEESALNQP